MKPKHHKTHDQELGHDLESAEQDRNAELEQEQNEEEVDEVDADSRVYENDELKRMGYGDEGYLEENDDEDAQ